MQDSILPQTLEGWLGIIAQMIVIFSAVSLVFHKAVVVPMVKDIADTKDKCSKSANDIADMQKKQQASEFDRAALHQDVGRVQGMVDRSVQQMEAMRDAAHRDQMEIVERLSRIEANVNVAASLDRFADKIANVLKDK